MYAWIFSHLPGPVVLKALQAAVLLVVVVYALFTWVFPWAAGTFSFLGRDPGLE